MSDNNSISLLLSIITLNCFLTANSQQTSDYRDLFTGNYYGYVRETSWSVYDTVYPDDTIVGLINISRFHGFTILHGSNYSDTIHKIAITYHPYSLDYDDSKCGVVFYYTDGFLHPTIGISGDLSYPELTSCESSYLVGYCNGDSLYVDYCSGNNWGGFRNTIYARRTAESINDPGTAGDKVILFPNPCQNEISIKGVPPNTYVQITDLLGRIRISEIFDSEKVQVSNLQPGIYLCTLNADKLHVKIIFIKN